MGSNVDGNQPVAVVGIGASAGGLDALKRFFRAVPDSSRLAFVVVQHLDPHHKSMMAEILERETSMRVTEAENNQAIEANCAYIIPPNAYTEVADHTIVLTQPMPTGGLRMSIDFLFRSMAEAYGARAIGVVLSGTGSDGTAGLRVLQASGGLTVVQDPKTAEYPSMPRSAMEAGVVDTVLKAEAIPEMLLEYARHPYVNLDDKLEKPAEDDLRTVGILLKTRESFDLGPYKETTVQRRLCRRMSLTGKANLGDYIELLREDDHERANLLRDLLISVTDFFRDRRAYEVLEEKAIATIVRQAEEGSEIRVWVAGCATGEEAYSLAMLAMEKIEQSGKELDLKLFATDIDTDAIRTARKGVYSASITAELPPALLTKYFNPVDDNYYKVLGRVRDKIAFAVQNLSSDPPFSRMDLISCRNLLIYLRPAVQKSVLQSFYVALNPGGYLFLGSSESLGEQKSFFEEVSQKWRVFRRREQNGEENPSATATATAFGGEASRHNVRYRSTRNVEKSDRPAEQARAALLQCVGPSVLIDGDNRVIYLHGDLHDFIRIPPGEPRLDFTQMLDPFLRTRLRSGLFKARRSGEKVIIQAPKTFKDERPDTPLFQMVICLANHSGLDKDALIITFEQAIPDREYVSPLDDLQPADQDKMVEEMERELVETREELQNTGEELETSTEELKASHEEALSTNEELQSANEELEANTEELRSLNEELSTVNEQLKDKIRELETAHDDLQNFFASTNLAIVFLNNDLRIKRYTPAAERLLRIAPPYLNRTLQDVSRDLDLIDDTSHEDARLVLETLEFSEKELESRDGRWFARRILPYRTDDRRVSGVVITITDITALKSATLKVQARERQHAVIARLGMEALSNDKLERLMDHVARETAHTLNADYCQVLEYRREHPDLLLKAGVGWRHGAIGVATVAVDTGSQAGYTLQERKPVIVSDLKEENRFSGSALLTEHDVVSGMSCAIQNGDHPYGVLGVHTRQKREFTADDANFLMSAANLLSIALHRKRAEEELKASEERLNMAREAAKIGIHDFHVPSQTVKWDEKVYELWGIDQDVRPVTYEMFERGLHEDDRKRVREVVEKATQGDGFRVEYRVINQQDKKTRWVEATAKTSFENGRAVRMVGTVRDISTRKHVEERLKRAVDQLEAADWKKNEFLATLGHELRNPLAALSSGIQVMQSDLSESEWALNMMARNVGLCSSLLDELLDLTRISLGKIKLKKKAVDLKEIVRSALAGFKSTIEQNNQVLASDLTSAPVFVDADPNRIEQILSNLLTNACKFTPEQGRIRVALWREGSEARLAVEDNGVGIPPDKLESIFEPFEQLSRGPSGGTDLGVGLHLVRQFAQLHGGGVEAWSEGPGRGATFTLHLPVIEDPHAACEEQAPKEEPTLKEALRVLIVDDNKDAVRGLTSMLKMKKCQVAAAYSGAAALAEIETFEPEVVIADIGLPDMDGYELLREIKKHRDGGCVYIAVTGYGHEEARAQSKQAGFDFHFNKPVDYGELLQLLSEIP